MGIFLYGLLVVVVVVVVVVVIFIRMSVCVCVCVCVRDGYCVLFCRVFLARRRFLIAVSPFGN